MSNKIYSIWPDFSELAVAFLIVVAVFYFTGLELRFQKDGDWGLYMSFGIEKFNGAKEEVSVRETPDDLTYTIRGQFDGNRYRP